MCVVSSSQSSHCVQQAFWWQNKAQWKNLKTFSRLWKPFCHVDFCHDCNNTNIYFWFWFRRQRNWLWEKPCLLTEWVTGLQLLSFIGSAGAEYNITWSILQSISHVHACVRAWLLITGKTALWLVGGTSCIFHEARSMKTPLKLRLLYDGNALALTSKGTLIPNYFECLVAMLSCPEIQSLSSASAGCC